MSDAVQQHYTSGTLQRSVLDAIVAAGHDPDHLDPAALTPAEEFHTFGRAATIALAEAAHVVPADLVLDVGSGLGGPARHLARTHGCHVTGVDLTQELCDVAADLTRRVDLDGLVTIRQGDATDLPFDDGRFDLVWTQHASMNIEDKVALFHEMRRVCAGGGRLAFFDILAGAEEPLHFPVPWSDGPATSFLATAEETRDLLTRSGFAVRTWEDLTEEAVAFFGALAAPAAPSPLGLHLLIPDMATKGANLRRNVEESRIAVVRCVADAV